MPRIARIGVSFAAVLVAYSSYALIAVPLIEPKTSRSPSQPIAGPGGGGIEQQLRTLDGLFPPDSWVLKNAKILQSDQVKLLIRDYTNLGNGKVEIRPCAMVYTPNGPVENEEQRRRQSVVLEAPEGAILQFDQAFDLSQGKIGRLVNGRLNGRIVIRSDSKLPGPDDDLLVVTRDVQITEQDISTPHEVDFRYGPNYGHGRQLFIKLLPGNATGGLQQRGPSVAGIELFRITQLDRLHLDFSKKGLLGGQAAKMAPPAQSSGAPKGSQAGSAFTTEPAGPVEISCQGAFSFSPVQQLITFEDHVDVLQIHPDGPSDQLSCERLTIYLARPRETAGQTAPKGKKASTATASLDLQPRRIEAVGRPVVFRAPSRNADGRAERLEYNLELQRIVLEGQQQEVVLRQNANEIHAVSLQYQSAGPGRIGQMVSQGPGWLRARMADRFPQPVGARWNDQLRVQPGEEQRQVVSLTGGAELTYGAMGTLTAEQIYFWLFEAPPDSLPHGQSQLRPDKALAQRNVQFNSTQLSGALSQMEVWFSQAQVPSPQANAADEPSPDATPSAAPVDLAGRLRTLIPTALKLARRYPALAQAFQRQLAADVIPGAGGLLAPTGRPEHYHVTGDLLRCEALVQGEQAQLTDLLIDGNVRVQQTQMAQPHETPILITGDQIHVVNANQPSASAVTITGTVAHFEGPRIGLTGTNINLNRGTNRLWIDGAGRMDLAIDRDLEGQPLATPQTLQIEWQRQMNFNGRTVHFEESVVATAPQQQLQSETLDVTLQQMVRFDALNSKQPVQPQLFCCTGGVAMESQTTDAQGLVSREKMKVNDLKADLMSGALEAHGPGWMTSVRRQAGDPLGPADGMPMANPADPVDPNAVRLVYMHVTFQDRIRGNMKQGQREMVFYDHVKTVYGPVPTWEATLDPNNPDSLGPEGFLLTCDQLRVGDMSPHDRQGQAVELEATGNTVVEGQMFTAGAVRMTYAKEKDLLVLEGDGRTNAELSGQKHVGGQVSTAAARKILFWPKTRRLSIDGGRWLELNDLPTLTARPQ